MDHDGKEAWGAVYRECCDDDEICFSQYFDGDENDRAGHLETFFGEAEKMSVNPRKYFTMIISQRPVFHTNASTTMNK